MKGAVAAETDAGEPRVAAVPETVKKMIGLGAEVAVESGAGVKSGVLDADYTAAGATISADVLSGADVVLQVRRPQGAELSRVKKGAIVIAIMDPYATTLRHAPWGMPASPALPWSVCRAPPARSSWTCSRARPISPVTAP